MSRTVIEAFSTRRAEIEAAMVAQGIGDTKTNPHLAARAALVTRAHKRDVDKEALRESWRTQAADLGFDVRGIAADAERREAPRAADREALAHAEGLTGPEKALESAADRGRRMGRGASLGARGGVLADEPPHGRPRLEARCGDDRRGRGGRGAAGEGRHPARSQPPRAGRLAHHRQGRGRRAGDHCAHGARPGAGRGPDARARSRQGAAQRALSRPGRRRR